METLSFAKGWYLIYTNVKQEKKVAEQLDKLNIPNFLPLVKVTRLWSDRVKILSTPLFPCYLFVYLAQCQDYNHCLDIKGLLRFVRFGQEIAHVPDAVIADLKLLMQTGENIEVSLTEFQQGESVVIGSGPLEGLNCEVVRYNNRDMILVRLGLLQRSLLIELPVNCLCKI